MLNYDTYVTHDSYFKEIRRRPRDRNITSQDLTQHLLFHNLKIKKLNPADENSLEHERVKREDYEITEDIMSDEGEERFLSDQGEDEFQEELVSF